MVKRSDTNRVVHEEQGIVRRPRGSRIAIWGASIAEAKATYVPSEVYQSQKPDRAIQHAYPLIMKWMLA